MKERVRGEVQEHPVVSVGTTTLVIGAAVGALLWRNHRRRQAASLRRRALVLGGEGRLLAADAADLVRTRTRVAARRARREMVRLGERIPEEARPFVLGAIGLCLVGGVLAPLLVRRRRRERAHYVVAHELTTVTGEHLGEAPL